jgi:membrane protein
MKAQKTTRTDYFQLIKDTVKAWTGDNIPDLAAALSYYTIFSMAPLILIVISIAGIVMGESTVRNEITTQLQSLLGNEGARFIVTAIKADNQKNTSIIASLIGFAVLLFGASGVFGHLKKSFNQIWHVEKVKKGIGATIKENLFSFGLVVGIGFLLLVSLMISTIISVIGTYFQHILPFPSIVLQLINTFFSFVVIACLFAAMFKALPDTKIAWSDVWIGGVVTSFLFSIGKVAIGWYLAHSAEGAKYGAAGSVVVVLLWIYYASQILFLGAEFTKVYCGSCGSRANVPEKHPGGPSKTAEIAGSFIEGFVKGIEKKVEK